MPPSSIAGFRDITKVFHIRMMLFQYRYYGRVVVCNEDKINRTEHFLQGQLKTRVAGAHRTHAQVVVLRIGMERTGQQRIA